MNSKRVFILGAGFSKQAGMPLATELTDLLRLRFEYRKKDKAIIWFDDLKHRLNGPCAGENGNSNGVNFEQIFDLARFDFEHCLAKNKIQMAADIDHWLNGMERSLITVIWEKIKKIKESRDRLDSISRFTEMLDHEDVIITFNYDTLVEECLSSQDKLWSNGFACEERNGTEILKMHGSINWGFPVQKGDSYKLQGTLLFSREPNPNRSEFYELVRIESNHFNDHYFDPSWTQTIFIPCIVTPGSHKSPLPFFGYELWSKATNVLEQAQEIYIIGFSLSPFDTIVRWHFGSTMYKRAEKKNPPRKITLIDPKADELQDNFKSVFGLDTPIETIKKPAEEVDWSEVLL